MRLKGIDKFTTLCAKHTKVYNKYIRLMSVDLPLLSLMQTLQTGSVIIRENCQDFFPNTFLRHVCLHKSRNQPTGREGIRKI